MRTSVDLSDGSYLEFEEVRDNGGVTFDRYTAGFCHYGPADETGDREMDRFALLIGPTGNHPQGVCMHHELGVSEDDGELVEVADLPEPVRKAIDGELGLALMIDEQTA